jgi:hypothetical protein
MNEQRRATKRDWELIVCAILAQDVVPPLLNLRRCSSSSHRF